jgi:tetratricopeptide (TPR) repeat protein
MQNLLYVVALSLLAGCATPAFQTEALLKRKGDIPRLSMIETVPFILQKKNHCGPASLAMILKHQKKNVNISELTEQMYTPVAKGTYQSDMVSSARRQSMMVLPVNSLESLLKEIAAGNPVLVFQNLGLQNLPKWHYAVALGYDLNKTQIILHSGPKKKLKLDLRVFEHTWTLAKSWGIVVLPPGKLSSTAKEIDHAEAAAGLELLEKFDDAEKAYISILKKWPTSLSAHIGMGNIRYSQQKFSEAVIYLTAATIKHPDSAVAWHNLAHAQGAARMFKDAGLSSSRAISLTESREVEIYRKSLKAFLPMGN